MPKQKHISSKKKGLSPGSLIYTGSKKSAGTHLSCFIYDAENYTEIQDLSLEKLHNLRSEGKVLWVNIRGLQQPEVIEEIGNIFSIHRLILEDIMNVFQRPKLDDYENYIFVILKSLNLNKTDGTISVDQFSLILGRNFVLSFQDVNENDVIEPIQEKIRKNLGRIRKAGADYLLYRLMDQIIDDYYVTLEEIGDRIETLEEELLTNPSQDSAKRVHQLKKEMLAIRRAVWPLREVVYNLDRNEYKLIDKSSSIFLRDLYDHVIQIIDTIENDRDVVSGMLDIYLSSLSNKMNEIIKVLTMISTIFIPLTFIVGLYGMNFNTAKSPLNMPELNYYYGYPLVLLVMLIISVLLVVFFKKKRWF